MFDTHSEIRDGMRIDWDVPIPVRDGGVLAADVFRPVEEGEYPVLLAAGPYGKGLPFAEAYQHQWTSLLRDHPEVLDGSTGAYQVWEYCDPERWVPLGYVCVRVDTRGTGGSPGEIDFFSPQETRDLYDCVEWAGTRPWSTGKVGLLGISYLATNQWQVAALRPPHLAAICPWEGASDYYREYTHHGGMTSEFMPSWMPYQVTTVQNGRPDAAANPHNGRRVTGPEEIGEDERAKLRIAIGDVLDDRPLCDDYYRDRTADLAEVTVPVLSASNWGGMGLHSRGNFNGYLGVSSTDKWLEVHGLEHWTEFYTDYGLDVQRRFFDHFLKGADNGWDATARVQLKVRTPDGFFQRAENEWPLARTRWTRCYLDLDAGTLSRDEPTSGTGASFRSRHEVLNYRSRAVDEPLEITGPLAMKLFVSSTTDDADIFVNVHLYDPQGTEVVFVTAFEPKAPLTQGWLRMSHREIDPDLSTPHQPWHPHTRVDPLTPGTVYEADIEVWPTSIVMPPGYTLGVSIGGVDYTHGLPGPHHIAYGRELLGSGPYWHEHPGDRDKPAFDGTTTLISEPGRRPYLLLPIVPADRE
ncbi:CocE/NonD family hydrolase [Mycobacterium sp. NPDC003449]